MPGFVPDEEEEEELSGLDVAVAVELELELDAMEVIVEDVSDACVVEDTRVVEDVLAAVGVAEVC